MGGDRGLLGRLLRRLLRLLLRLSEVEGRAGIGDGGGADGIAGGRGGEVSRSWGLLLACLGRRRLGRGVAGLLVVLGRLRRLRRGPAPRVLRRHLLRGILVARGAGDGPTLLVATVLRLLGGLRVGWMCGRAVVLLWRLLARVEALSWPGSAGGTRRQRGIRARCLPRGREVVTPDTVLAIRLGEAFLEHTVVVADNRREFGVEVEQGV